MSINRLFVIRAPVIQAPMAGMWDADPAAAVANAGGVGSLPCATLGLAELARELTRFETLTDRPFNVNFFCYVPPLVAEESQANGLKALAPCCRELDLAIPSGPACGQRQPWV